MLIEDLPAAELARRLHGEGVDLVTGACTFRVRSHIPRLADDLRIMYGAYRLEDEPGIVDATLDFDSRRSWRKPSQTRVKVRIDDERELEGLPVESVYAAFESALNWSIALCDVAPLLMHAAVLERDGHALILPAPAGSGKSTLCAALACSGWRLFSDEMAIFSADNFELLPNPRPVSLKNDSIGLLRTRYPDAHVGSVITGTPKGNVAYMRAPRSSVLRCGEAAPAALVVKPVYTAGAVLSAERLGKVEAFRLLTQNAVNYASMLRLGFEAMTTLVERCGCYLLTYSDLDEAIAVIDELHVAHANS